MTATHLPPVEPAPRRKTAAEANPNLLRDRLANERTFLSWLRTGIAITSLGFVVARFDIFLYEMARVSGSTPESSKATIPIGVVLVLAGPLIILLASFRYLHTDRALLANRADSRRLVRSIVLSITIGSLIAGAALVLHLLALWPE